MEIDRHRLSGISHSSDGGAAASPRGDYEGSTHEHDGEKSDIDSNDNDGDSDWTPASDDSSGDEVLGSSGYEDEDANDSRFVVYCATATKDYESSSTIIYNYLGASEEFVNDPMYDAPKDEDERKVEEMQKARAINRKEAAKKKKPERAAAVTAKRGDVTTTSTEENSEAMDVTESSQQEDNQSERVASAS
ncbi:hypothetical protein PI125_g14238 [Phytophthora idaei]|nr:hypothetical protein PI125_g14238 [Phytophthora idaei]